MNYLYEYKEKEADLVVIQEAFFVGIYTLFIYIILSFFITNQNPLLLFFILGFVKHFLGDFIQLHTFFCNYGYACTYYFGKDNILHRISDRKEIVIIIESILEGFLFMLFCGIAILAFGKKWVRYWIFFIGFFIHYLFEKIGIHRLFCKYRCSNKS